MLSVKTQGVDLKTNPLLLGNAKLHSAVNMVFEENTIKTRPGFRFVDLKISGVFQGACEYRPSRGLSAGVFSEDLTGVVAAVSGDLYFSEVNACGELCRTVQLTRDHPYVGLGDVHLYQAENYLIAQNPQGPTLWWNGIGLPVRSPGAMEQDWNDPDTPSDEPDVVKPVAEIAACDFDGGGVTVTFFVVDSVTGSPIQGAQITVYRNNVRMYRGFTDSTGKWRTKTTVGNYVCVVTADGYDSTGNSAFSVSGTEIEYTYEACTAPIYVVAGEALVSIVLKKSEGSVLPASCFSVEQVYVSDQEVLLRITNESDLSLRVYAITSEVDLTFDASFPIVVPAATTVEVTVTSDVSLAGITFSVMTECTDSLLKDVPFISGGGGDETLYVHLTFAHYAEYGNPFFLEEEDIEMTGSVSSGTFTGTCSKGDLTLEWDPEYVYLTTVGAWLMTFDEPVLIFTGPDTAGPTLTEIFSVTEPDNVLGSYLEHKAAPFPHWLATVSNSPP